MKNGGPKSKKIEFFKSTQNAFHYSLLVFLGHFLIIFDKFWVFFTRFESYFSMCGPKNNGYASVLMAEGSKREMKRDLEEKSWKNGSKPKKSIFF